MPIIPQQYHHIVTLALELLHRHSGWACPEADWASVPGGRCSASSRVFAISALWVLAFIRWPRDAQPQP